MSNAPKWAGNDGQPRKSIYHSYLVREPGLMVKLKGEVRDSKFPGKPPFVYLQVPDDENEYALNLEAETVESFKAAPKGVWLRVHAKGSKDTPPSVTFADESGPVFADDDFEPVPESGPGSPKPQDGPPPMWPEKQGTPKAATPPAKPTTTHSQTMRGLWNDAVTMIREIEPDATPDAVVEAAARICNTMFIQASR